MSVFDLDENNEQETAETIEDSESSKSLKKDKPKKKKKNLRQWLEDDDTTQKFYLIFGFFAIALLMVLYQFSTQAVCCGDWDGYYHIRWSALLWENISSFKWLPEFKWLPLTVLNPNDYADHHFLFHILQIPFLWFFEAVTAAKVAAIFYGSLAVFSVYWLLYRYKVDYLILWLLAILTCSSSFFYRINMAKAPPLTIIYTIIGIYLLFERKYIWLLPLMFLFVWTYSLFPLLLVAAVLWVLVILWNERKFEWQPLAYTTGGMILGNVINPYFPNNIYLFIEHFSTKLRSKFEVSVGGEWYSYDGWQLITNLSIALIAMLVGYILFRPRGEKLPEKATFFLMFSTILLIWMFKSKRLAEYFPPFAILFGAFSWRAFITPISQLPEEFRQGLEQFLDKDLNSSKTDFIDIFKQSAPWVIGTFLFVILLYNIIGINFGDLKQDGLITTISKNEPNDKYEEAMEWAKENIPEGERIFNCNWDNFPKLFFFNTKHSYVYGLDPNYLYSQDKELYKLVKEITSGKTDDPAPIIREKFGANYIFSDAKENEDFIAKILESGWAERVYDDEESIILKIRKEQGEPPVETEDDTPLTPEEEEELRREEEKEANNVNVNETNEENLPEEANENLPEESEEVDENLPEEEEEIPEEGYEDEEIPENENAESKTNENPQQ